MKRINGVLVVFHFWCGWWLSGCSFYDNSVNCTHIYVVHTFLLCAMFHNTCSS